MRALRKLHRWGVPASFDYGVVELAANVLLFLPLGALVARILGARLWWGGVAVGFVVSVLIELAQLVFLPARFPSVADVAANTFGAMVGAFAAQLGMAFPGRAGADPGTYKSAAGASAAVRYQSDTNRKQRPSGVVGASK